MYTVIVTSKQTGEVVAVENNVRDEDVDGVMTDWGCDPETVDVYSIRDMDPIVDTNDDMVYCPSCGELHRVPIERCKRFMSEYQMIDESW